MATLHVRNVPEDIYERLREEARSSDRSINAATIALLRHSLRERPGKISWNEFLAQAAETRAAARRRPGGPSAVEAIREDRDR